MPQQTNPLQELYRFGQSIWLDSIQRGQIISGDLKKLITEDGIAGETANPTIFEKAIDTTSDYDEAIEQGMASGKSSLEIYEAIAISDVSMAADLFRPVYNRTRGGDGFVSIEVSPVLAHNTQGTIAEVRRFYEAIHRPNVMVKIPGTIEGLPAIEECLYQGININITLLFSVKAYEDVAWAYIRALERRLKENKPIDRIASVASFFVSRIDTLADTIVEEKMKQEPALKTTLASLPGTIAIANAKIAYQRFKEIFNDRRFLDLKTHGARVQRPLWASTSTKNPRYPDILYVESLIGPDTVNTLPLETIKAFQDHGRPRLSLEEDLDGALQTFKILAEAGISIDAITQQVLDEGVEKFDNSLKKLLQGIEAKRGKKTKAYAMSGPQRGERNLSAERAARKHR